MSEELITAKLDEINSSTELEPTKPTLPVSIALQEAENLFDWCTKDKEALVMAGLDWSLVDDLQTRAGALRVAQAKWSSEYKSYQDCQAEWKIEAPAAFNMRDELVHHFYHALFNNPNEYAKVQRIDEGTTNADMIQDLMDLSELGMKHTTELESIGMDLALLDDARAKSFELAELLAKVNGSVQETSPTLEIRDKAFVHLKVAVDEIRRVGQYVFWRNNLKLKGYVSRYFRTINQRSRKKEEELGEV